MELSGIFGILLIRERVALGMQGLRDHFLFRCSFLETVQNMQNRQKGIVNDIHLP